jgi:hypothetical protein
MESSQGPMKLYERVVSSSVKRVTSGDAPDRQPSPAQ